MDGYGTYGDPYAPGGIYVSPGAGAVIGETTLQDALANLVQLLIDTGGGEILSHDAEIDEDGRLNACTKTRASGIHEIEMPGLPLEQVRYLADTGQNIWDYPRIFVDGNDWVWCYAVQALREKA